MVASFLPLTAQRKERSKEGKPPPGHSGLRIWARCLKRRNSLRSNSRLFRAASAPNPSPAGRPSFKRAGKLHQFFSVSRIFQMRIPFASVFSHGGADLHHDLNDFGAAGAGFIFEESVSPILMRNHIAERACLSCTTVSVLGA